MAHGKVSFHIPAKRSAEDISQLKAQWNNDPCWDIEETEGFEAHRAELLNYRLEQEKLSRAKYERELMIDAERYGIPDNLKLAKYIQSLEIRLAKLEENDSN